MKRILLLAAASLLGTSALAYDNQQIDFDSSDHVLLASSEMWQGGFHRAARPATESSGFSRFDVPSDYMGNGYVGDCYRERAQLKGVPATP